MWPLPMMHWTSLHWPPPLPKTWDMGPPGLSPGPTNPQHGIPQPWPLPDIRHGIPHPRSLLVTSGGNQCWPLQICSLEDPLPLPLVLTSGGVATKAQTVDKRYTSSWNSFLSQNIAGYGVTVSRFYLWHCLKLAKKHFYTKGIQCGGRFDNFNWLCFSF